MTDSFTEALERLDPASRALLDLSLRRGMRTEEIAEILGAEPDGVASSRDEALRRVAATVGMGESEEQLDQLRARLAELPAEEWLGGGAAAGAESPTPADEDTEPVAAEELDSAEPEVAQQGAAAPETTDEDQSARALDDATLVHAAPPSASPAEDSAAPETEPVLTSPDAAPAVAEPSSGAGRKKDEPTPSPLVAGARRKRSVWPALLALLFVAGVIVLIAVAAGGGGDESPDTTGASGTSAEPADRQRDGDRQGERGGDRQAEPSGGVRLAPVGGPGSGAQGTARVTGGGRLELDVTGLPEPNGNSAYQVWLYKSVIDARGLGNFRSGDIELDTKLPDDWKRYGFIDVSLEAGDANRSHSGRSVMRVPTRRLAPK